MLHAAAEAVAGQVDVSQPGAALLPAVENLRASSATSAIAVVKAANADGVTGKKIDNTVQAVQDAMWQPTYDDAAMSEPSASEPARRHDESRRNSTEDPRPSDRA